MTHTPASEERAAGKQVRAGAAMPVSALHPVPEPPVPSTPRAATGRGVVVYAAGAQPARSGHSRPGQLLKEVDMFEGQPQTEVEALMKGNNEFRQLYQRHKELDKQVLDAELGVLPIDDATLARMKREKLAAKDRLTRLYDASH